MPTNTLYAALRAATHAASSAAVLHNATRPDCLQDQAAWETEAAHLKRVALAAVVAQMDAARAIGFDKVCPEAADLGEGAFDAWYTIESITRGALCGHPFMLTTPSYANGVVDLEWGGQTAVLFHEGAERARAAVIADDLDTLHVLFCDATGSN